MAQGLHSLGLFPNCFATFTGASVSSTLVAPLKRCTILMQAHGTTWTKARQVVKKQGFWSNWSGNLALCVASLGRGLSEYTFFDGLLALLAPPNAQTLIEFRVGTALGLSNFCGALLAYPLLLIGTRIATDKRAKTDKYKGYRDCFRHTVAQEGYRGLYKGIGICFVYHMVHSLVYLKAHQFLVSRYAGENQAGSAMSLLVYGCVAGMAAQLVAYPIETVMVRMQLSGSEVDREGPYPSTSECIKTIYKNHGILGFYRGASISCITHIPVSVLEYFVSIFTIFAFAG